MSTSDGRRCALPFMIWVFLLVALSAHAQTTGVITGTVTDSTGAVVPGAKVIVRSAATGAERKLETNGSGIYNAYSLSVGQYEVEVTSAGFKKSARSAIQVNVADQLAINFALEVGDASQSVDVVATTPDVQTEKGDVSHVVSEKQMTDLAVNGRTFTLLQQLLPGASRMAGDEGGTGFSSSKGFSINGGRQDSTGFLIDGVENTDMGNGVGLMTSPGMETIGEFKMQTANYSAEYGTAGGANMLVVTRTGAKDFHGAAYEFLRNDAMDARYFFANSKPILRYNNFGYRIGGPAFIPKLYNRNHDKTFFFFAQEWRKKKTESTYLAATPTQDMRSGNFASEALRTGQNIIDPVTGIPFPNNQIPTNRLNANAQLLLQSLFPMPNQSGFLNYVKNGANPDDWRQETVNVTHYITPNNQLTFRMIQDTEVMTTATSLWGGQAFPNIGSIVTLPGHSYLAKVTSSISSTLLNEVSYAYGSNYGKQGSPAVVETGPYLAPDGLTIQRLFPLASGRPNKVPNLSFAGGWGGIDTSYYPWWAHHSIQTINDNLSKTVGTHSFKFGGTWQYSITPVEAQSQDQGAFNFDGHFTGHSIADFLLGDAQSYSQLSQRLTPYYDYHQLELYAQDSWKVTSRLTLNLGVRYFYIPHLYEEKNLLYNFLPGKFDPAKAVTVLPDGSIQPNSGNPLNGILGVKDGLSRDLVNNYPWTFGPRLGFAWDPTGQAKWAIRGGYGIGYYRTQGNDSYAMVGNPPGAATVTVSNPSLNNPASGQAGALYPYNFNSLDMNYKVPTVQTYSLIAEHEIMPGTAVSLGYVGSRGTHLDRARNINQPLPVSGYNFDPRLNSGYPGALDAPYAGFATINQKEETASSTYHSLQATFKRRMSKGLLFEAAYTWSKAITDASGFGQTPQDSYNTRAERGLADFDRPQMLILNGIYDLPFFKNQKTLASQLLGGWEISGVAQFQSGTPLTVGVTGATGLATRPNVIYGQSSSGPQTQSEWFNTAAFAFPAAGFFGNAGQNIVRGPGVEQFDFSLFKRFRIGEKFSVQLRGEAFNILNHTSWSSVSTNLGAGDFGQVNGAHEARVVQVSMKAEF